MIFFNFLDYSDSMQIFMSQRTLLFTKINNHYISILKLNSVCHVESQIKTP